jgi:hypothetical protein
MVNVLSCAHCLYNKYMEHTLDRNVGVLPLPLTISFNESYVVKLTSFCVNPEEAWNANTVVNIAGISTAAFKNVL